LTDTSDQELFQVSHACCILKRKERKNRKLQPIGTELSSFLLNSTFLSFEISLKNDSPNFSTFFTCFAIYDANQI